MMKRILIVIALVAILATSCASSPENVDSDSISEGGAPGYVYDFEVNGTRCIAFTQKAGFAGSGGLSCDFSD